MASLTAENLLSHLNQFKKQANAIRTRHNTDKDQKMLADPILNYEIGLTPKLLQFGNLKVLTSLYN